MEPPTFSRQQLVKYFTRATNGRDSGEERLKNIEQAIRNDSFEALADLQRVHLATISFSNIALHYSPVKRISIKPDDILHRLVERGLGGYCMESTGLFLIVLRTLGYKVYPTGARVSNAVKTGADDGGYGGWTHMTLIVILDQGKYMVDAGMSSLTPVRPLPMVEDCPALTGISPAQIRLRKDCIKANTYTDNAQKLWIVENRNDPESQWLPAYCFSEIEFGHGDFEVMNFNTSQNPEMWFSFKFVCTKMILNERGDETIGQVILNDNELKKRVHGVTEQRDSLETEKERIAALEKWFGVQLREDEIEGIRGKVTELPRS